MISDEEKELLHQQLDELIPSNARGRASHVRIVGHALIALGLLNRLECGWEHCKYDSRDFVRIEPDPEVLHSTLNRKMTPSIDHVVGVKFGGSDRPENLMMLHFGCNSAKGMLDVYALRGLDPRADESIKRRADATRARWADPEERARIVDRLTNRTSEQKAQTTVKRSKSMAAWWASDEGELHKEHLRENPTERMIEGRKRQAQALKDWWARQKDGETDVDHS